RDTPGVALVYTRTKELVRIPLGEGERAASGEVVSLPDRGRPPLNDVYLRSGRLPEVGHTAEVLLLEACAKAHDIAAGDRIAVVLNGTHREVLVTGLAMSREYVFAIGGDVMSYEPGSFAVLWIRQAAVNAAFDMEGAF